MENVVSMTNEERSKNLKQVEPGFTSLRQQWRNFVRIPGVGGGGQS